MLDSPDIGLDGQVAGLGETLIGLGKLAPAELERAGQDLDGSDRSLAQALRQLGLVGSQDIAEALSRLHGLPLARAESFPELPVLEDQLSARFLREARILPLEDRPDGVLLALADPQDRFALDAVRLATGKPVILQVASEEEIEAALERLYGPGKSALEQIVDDISGEADEGEVAEEDAKHLKDLALEAPVVRLVNQIINDAVAARASDIHIEPFRDELKLRYRVDGILREITPPPLRLAKVIVSRIKILAGLNIAERRLPQDGRARVRVGQRRLDMRIATMPTAHGESVVIRLLDDDGAKLDLRAIGLAPHDEVTLRRQLHAPHGMIIVTGPTGSGKTTTLASSLVLLNEPSRKIVTVEDPIEYQIPGINQLQVKPGIGLTFANALRSFVRQDPDVIMVGEMRDGETADIAIHAALTGHLVLSTLHTNNAAGAVTRLLDMEVDAFLLASTLRLLVGQRLVRHLCEQCRSPYAAPANLIEQARQLGVLDTAREAPNLYKAQGCEACNGIGYVGRVGIFELFEVTERIQRLIRPGITTGELQEAGRENGMTIMFEDGLAKAFAGETTIEEVYRVTEDSAA
jgi:general secretion pathway protein E